MCFKEVILPLQDEHGDAMEKNEWVHEGSRWCCKVDACICFYAPKWLFCKNLDQTHGFQMQLSRYGCPSICPKVVGNKTTFLWMFVIWTTCMQVKNGMKRMPSIK